MHTASRKSFFSFLIAMTCLLCVLSYAQNTQGPLTATDFDQFTWRWVGPTTFSGRITGLSVPRGQSQTYYALTGSGGQVDNGVYKITLTVDGKDVETKKMNVLPDPLFK